MGIISISPSFSVSPHQKTDLTSPRPHPPMIAFGNINHALATGGLHGVGACLKSSGSYDLAVILLPSRGCRGGS